MKVRGDVREDVLDQLKRITSLDIEEAWQLYKEAVLRPPLAVYGNVGI
jgi:hypothetical protein